MTPVTSKKRRLGKPALDITGHSYGELTPLSRAIGPFRHRGTVWECLCSCGEIVQVALRHLRGKVSGRTISCGHVREQTGGNYRHGGCSSSLYKCWSSMRERCSNPNKQFYYCYGARGISVCSEWQNSFIAFRNWALANGYADHLVLDRKDVDGNYEPDNCRWITRLQSANNMRSNVLLTAFGETKTVREWSRDMRCWASDAAMRSRIKQGGMSDAEIITRPSRRMVA